MSKLYVHATTDAVKTPRTARGHHEATASIAYNFSGGNTPAGEVEISAIHTGHAVRFEVCRCETNGKSTILQSFTIEENPCR